MWCRLLVIATASSLAVPAAVVLAAMLHASWNALGHAVKDQLALVTLMGATSLAVGVLGLLVVPLPAGASWPFLVASVLLHLAYNALLMAAYRVGDFNQSFPLARGTAPLLVAVVGALLGEQLGLAGLLGVAVIAGAMALLVLPGYRQGMVKPKAVTMALATGAAIASYTVMDGLGVRRSGSPLGYIGFLFLLQGLAIGAYAFAKRGRALMADCRAVLSTGLAAGVLSFTAYALVLWAQTRGALAMVAALRETSVVFAAIVGAVLFKEPFGRVRTAATVLVLGGIVLLGAGAA